jgi:SAM-dependent methyltransferase
MRMGAEVTERYQPPAHVAPDTFFHKLLFAGRLTSDFQFNTLHRHMRKFVPGVSGKVVDVGCGQGPFKHLVRPDKAKYIGLDFTGANAFGYNNPEVVYFDGKNIPFDTDSIDSVVCTEVLEHVEDAQVLVDEMYRVLKPGNRAVISIPWSARYHYIPFDFHRFTPARLKNMFAAFSSTTVEPRGTDITVIVSKSIVVYLRWLKPVNKLWLPLTLLAAVVTLPLLVVGVVVGHASLLLNIGSTDDPLGYTIWVEK